MNPEDQYTNEAVEFTEEDRQWFFDVNERFPITDEELAEFLDYKLENLAINQAEELAAEEE